MGHTPVIASIGSLGQGEKPIEREAIKRGIDVRLFRMRNGLNLLGAWKIMEFAKKNSFDILHCHGYKGNILFGLAPKTIRRIPVITTIHGWTGVNKFSRIKIYEAIDCLSFWFMEAVVVVNQAMLLRKRFRCLPNTVLQFHIDNGIAENNMHLDEVDEGLVDFCKNSFSILSIGRLSEEKGYDYLIHAFQKLTQTCHDAKLVIIGEGPYRNRLERIIKKNNLSGKVLLPGYRPGAKKYLEYCDVFVISSLTEGLPIALLEAMQRKVPVIATNVGAIPDVLGHGKSGLLVGIKDAELIYRSILELYNDRTKGALLAENASKVVREHYSSRAMVDKYIELYKRVINN